MKTTQHRISFIVLFIVVLYAANAWSLPPQVEAERLMLETKTLMDNMDYGAAVEKLDKIESLNVKLPETFAYHYGIALAGIGQWEKAKLKLDQYIVAAGSTGKFYKEALAKYNEVEHKQEEAAKAEAAKEAARIQAEIEAPRIAAEKEAARIKAQKEAAIAQEAARKAVPGEVKRYMDTMSSKGPNGNPISATLGTFYAPLFLPLFTTTDLKHGKSIAMTDPTLFGNPDSMIAQAIHLRNDREKNTVPLAVAQR